MKLTKTIAEFINYHKVNSKESTVRNYTFALCPFDTFFKDRETESINSKRHSNFGTKIVF